MEENTTNTNQTTMTSEQETMDDEQITSVLDPSNIPQTHLHLAQQDWADDPEILAALEADNGQLQIFSDNQTIIYDQASIVIAEMPPGVSPQDFLMEMANDLDKAINYQPFEDYFSETEESLNTYERRNPSQPIQVGEIHDIQLGIFDDSGSSPDAFSTIVAELSDHHFIISSISSGVTGPHPVNSSREFGFIENDNGSVTFYTKAAVQLSDLVEDLNPAPGGSIDTGWTELIEGIGQEIESRGGEYDPDSLSHWVLTSDQLLSQNDQDQTVIENEIVVGTPGNDQLQALDGDDLVSGFDGDDLLEAGSGNDLVLAGPGNDLALGEEGDDVIEGGDGDDELLGGDGIDLILGETGNDTILGGDSVDDLLGGDGDDTIVGGNGNDNILGEATFTESGDDQLFGGAGDDTISGVGGNDFVFGGLGNDRVLGGFDDDRVFGEEGNDIVVGSVGNDYVNGGDGDDIIIGSNPFLQIPFFAGFERDEMVGGAGSDTFVLGDAAIAYYDNQGGRSNVADSALITDFNPNEDFIQLKTLTEGRYVIAPGPNSSAGNEFTLDILIEKPDQSLELIASVQNTPELDLNASYFIYVEAEDEIIGTDGVDILGGTLNDDQIIGLAGNDFIASRAGDDLILAGPGDDLIVAAGGSDIVMGGAGNDVIAGGSEDDVLSGGEGELDSINGDAGDDFLDGGPGIDHLFGGDDNDVIKGGSGNDRIFGENGEDQIYGEDGNDDINAGEGDDTIFGGAGNDRVLGGAGGDRILGEAGDDTLDGAAGPDIINGGAGDDFLNGADDDDNLFADTGDDVMFGGSGSDLLVGASGDDILNGEAGDDVLIGVDPFNPTFGFGGAETDILTGGGGIDTFMLGNIGNVFYDGGGSNSTGAAIITDFNPHEDFIQLASVESANYILVPGSSSPSGEVFTDLFLERSDQSLDLIATLQGVNDLSLSADYFVFV